MYTVLGPHRNGLYPTPDISLYNTTLEYSLYTELGPHRNGLYPTPDISLYNTPDIGL